MAFWLVIALSSVFVAILLILRYFVHGTRCQRRVKFDGAHVMITGGSSGIGKALAVELAKRGASITLVARNKKRLESAVALAEQHCVSREEQTVQYVSVDLASDFKDIKKEVAEAEHEMGAKVDVLFNCAGYSLCGTFTELQPKDFKEMMDVNYLGSVAMTKCVVDEMIERKSGHIVFVSSIAGQLGLYGYAAYAPSKFAIRGLAETLSGELSPHNIGVSVVYPPDTDTPGFEEENKNKPEITKLISSASVLFTSEQVAEFIIQGIDRNQFSITCGLDGYIIGTLASGCSPASSVVELLLQSLLIGPLRLLWSYYLHSFNHIASKYLHQTKEKKNN